MSEEFLLTIIPILVGLFVLIGIGIGLPLSTWIEYKRYYEVKPIRQATSRRPRPRHRRQQIKQWVPAIAIWSLVVLLVAGWSQW